MKKKKQKTKVHYGANQDDCEMSARYGNVARPKPKGFHRLRKHYKQHSIYIIKHINLMLDIQYVKINYKLIIVLH